MPEGATESTLDLLRHIERELEAGNLDAANRLSLALNSRLSALPPESYLPALKITRSLLRTARREHAQLKAQLKSQRGAREGLAAYQQIQV